MLRSRNFLASLSAKNTVDSMFPRRLATTFLNQLADFHRLIKLTGLFCWPVLTSFQNV